MPGALGLINEAVHGERRHHPHRGSDQPTAYAIDSRDDAAAGYEAELVECVVTMDRDGPIMQTTPQFQRLVKDPILRSIMPDFPKGNHWQRAGHAFYPMMPESYRRAPYSSMFRARRQQ
jgi:hypothetical protein